MKALLLVGTGSFIGGIFRYVLSLFVNTKTETSFPFATLSVNLIGCFCIGLFFGMVEKSEVPQEWKLFIATGLLGGFTTFSAFSNETFLLFRNGENMQAVAYILASILLGLACTFLGRFTIQLFQ